MAWELIKGAIAKKALELSKASGTKPIKSKVTSGSTSSKTSTSSSNSTSGSSYAYDPSGNKVNVTIKNGQSYLSDGSRVGTGYTVQTGGGIYKMTDSGGVKVDSHNTAPTMSGGVASKQATSGGSIDYQRTPEPTGYTKTGNLYTVNRDIRANDPTNSFNGLNYDFDTKYDSIIRKLAESGGGTGKPVDMNVAKNMLASNIEQSMKGQEAMYTGGGVIKTDDWNQLVKDYQLLKSGAEESTMNTTTTDAYGNKLTGGDILSDLRNGGATIDYSLGQNLSGYSQDELAYGYNQVYGQGGGTAPVGPGVLTQGVVQQAPIQGGTIDLNMWADAIRAMSSGGQPSFVIDNHIQFPGSSNPTDGMYKSGQNYVVNQNGQLTEITEDDYVAYLASLIDL